MSRQILAAGVLLTIALAAHAAGPTHAALRDELLKMGEHDQEVRHATDQEGMRQWIEVDAANQARLKQIVDQYGWPTLAMVGEDAATAAWLLAQHADTDKAFQLKVLALMEPLVQQQQASAKDYAYLYDRTHSPQRYGTQGTCVSRTEWQPFEIEDIAHVDERRRALKMRPMADYAKLFDCSAPYIALHDPADPHRTVPVPSSTPVATP
ncbi:hypothetical protein NX784_07645 [Massilia pinisoli]|uniref:Uncharacterized protein n=1 Tax=Massilia pinisoli TaxID=1772194 RepID=A0ABT1ZNJ0_9BURK|nr:DUF6624 domain-containing protein [Massilia pinisoli]MCS0581460.1 hypothetical protein [Massilia pinisoli]